MPSGSVDIFWNWVCKNCSCIIVIAIQHHKMLILLSCQNSRARTKLTTFLTMYFSSFIFCFLNTKVDTVGLHEFGCCRLHNDCLWSFSFSQIWLLILLISFLWKCKFSKLIKLWRQMLKVTNTLDYTSNLVIIQFIYQLS